MCVWLSAPHATHTYHSQPPPASLFCVPFFLPMPCNPCRRRPAWLLLLLLCSAPGEVGAAGRRIKVQHLAPYVGRHNGGLLVNVTGRGFLVSTNPKCRFGAMEVTATVRSPTLMQCYTPVNTDFSPGSPYNAQDKALEVSLNGVDWTASKRSFWPR